MNQARILLLDADYRANHYESIREILTAEWLAPPWPSKGRQAVAWHDEDVFPPPWLAIDALPAERIDLVMVTSEWPPHIGATIAEYIRAGVPVLQLADGIVEWRQIWENPGMWSSAPLYQPILAHKLACLGRAQARVLESWGNVGKCEVAGSPRFDRLLGRKPRSKKPGAPFRILICTAQTPGFTEEQHRSLCNGLSELKTWIDENRHLGVEPVWRLASGMDAVLGVKVNKEPGSLADTLEHIDAVITTPSTVLLEGMLQGVPVVALDYTNSPQYVRAAWVISAPDHIEPVLRDLFTPASTRMLFQDFVLHDELECRSPAAPRVARLANEMISRGRFCRAQGTALDLPPKILTDPQRGVHLPEERYDLHSLYPKRSTVDTDITALQSEVLQLRRLLQIERDRFRRWAHWRTGNQILVGVRAAARSLLRKLTRESPS